MLLRQNLEKDISPRKAFRREKPPRDRLLSTESNFYEPHYAQGLKIEVRCSENPLGSVYLDQRRHVLNGDVSSALDFYP